MRRRYMRCIKVSNIPYGQDDSSSSLSLHNDHGSSKVRRPTPGSPLFGIRYVHNSRCRASAKNGSAPFTSMAEGVIVRSQSDRMVARSTPASRCRIPWVRPFEYRDDAMAANRQSDAYLWHTSVAMAAALSKDGLDERI